MYLSDSWGWKHRKTSLQRHVTYHRISSQKPSTSRPVVAGIVIHNRCTHLRSQVCAFDSTFQGRTHSDSLTLGQDFQAVNLRCDRISVSLWGIAARLPPDVPVREYQRIVVFIWNIIRYFHSHKHLHNSPLLHGLSAAAPAFCTPCCMFALSATSLSVISLWFFFFF